MKLGKAKMLEKKYCTKHEGEPNKFYCETCEKLVCRDCIVMKQCCRDHDYVTLQEAAEKQAGNVKKALEMCKKTETEILDKIKEIENAEAKLRKLLTEVQNVHEVGSGMSESASYFEIVSKYDEIKQVLAEAESHGISTWTETAMSQSQKLPNVDNHDTPTEENTPQGLQSLPVSNRVNSGLQEHWKQFGQFNVDMGYEIKGITITSSNETAVYSYGARSISGPAVSVKSRSGDSKHQFGIPDGCCIASPTNEMQWSVQDFGSGNRSFQISRPPTPNTSNSLSPHASSFKPASPYPPPTRSMLFIHQLAPSANPANDMYVIPTRSQQSTSQQSECIIYNTKGKELSSFHMADSDPKCVTLDNAGNILTGYGSDTISIHHKNGAFINKFKAGSRTYPIGIAATGKGGIAVIFKNTAPFFRILDYSGQILKDSLPPPGVMICHAVSICSSKKGELFVLNRGETDGVYMYTGEGDYVGCVYYGDRQVCSSCIVPR